MLVEFEVSNFLTFKEKVNFSMVANGISKSNPQAIVNLDTNKLNLLRSSVLYGANGSGKTNLLKALQYLQDSVVNQKINTEKLKQCREGISTESPTTLEVSFAVADKFYRYVLKTLPDVILEETLYYYRTTRPTVVFSRVLTAEDIDTYTLRGLGIKGKRFLDAEKWLTKLFLHNSHRLGKRDLHVSNAIYWITGKLHLPSRKAHSVVQEHSEQYSKDIAKILKNLGFDEIDYEKDRRNLSRFGSGIFSIVSLVSRLLHVFDKGGILFLDDAFEKIHTKVVHRILNEINCSTSKKCQVVSITHNTSLLNWAELRRDQVWFMEKKPSTGSSDLYSLADFKRLKENWEIGYITGRYGAIPWIGSFQFD